MFLINFINGKRSIPTLYKLVIRGYTVKDGGRQFVNNVGMIRNMGIRKYGEIVEEVELSHGVLLFILLFFPLVVFTNSQGSKENNKEGEEILQTIVIEKICSSSDIWELASWKNNHVI